MSARADAPTLCWMWALISRGARHASGSCPSPRPKPGRAAFRRRRRTSGFGDKLIIPHDVFLALLLGLAGGVVDEDRALQQRRPQGLGHGGVLGGEKRPHLLQLFRL